MTLSDGRRRFRSAAGRAQPADPPIVRRRTAGAAMGAAALVAVLVGSACSSSSFDRSAAVDGVLARYGDRLNRSQAECYVDRVADQLGADALNTDNPPPEQVPRLTRIRIDCAGVASLGTSLPTTSRPPTPGGGTAPMRLGANPALDRLHEECASGSGPACDELFDKAPVGSEYEDFALSCGNRTSELRCADRYPAPEVK